MDEVRVCEVSGCGRKNYGRKRFCRNHHYRHRHYGDPLGGRTPHGEVREYFEDVVLKYEGRDCLTWPYTFTTGSCQMWDNGTIRTVPRVICERVIGPAPTPEHEAAHSCGKAHLRCVAKNHLSWKTPKENAADKIAHGTDPRGERGPRAKLTEAQVREIRSLLGTASHRVIGEKFGVKHQTIWGISAGRHWAHIQ